MSMYTAVFQRDGKYISVIFPDVPEALTQGETYQEAFEKAEEVLGFALEDYKQLPKATNPEQIKEMYPNSMLAFIEIDMIKYMKKYYSKAVRKNVTIPEYLTLLAKEDKLNISKFLTDSLEKKYSL